MITTEQRKEELYTIVDKISDRLLFTNLTDKESLQLFDAQAELELIQNQELAEQTKKAKETKKRIKKVNKQFKRDEDWVNEQLGLKREGHMKRGISCPDGVNNMFSVDVTRTKSKLAFIRQEMADAKEHTSNARIPIIVVFQDSYERKHGIVVMEFQDFKDLHGN